MTHFRKMLKLAEQANKHAFAHAACNHRTEDISWWKYGGQTEAIKREHRFGTAALLTKFPKGELK